MATQIKITQLTNIGSANLVGTTLLPVVNMAGVPTTQKTTLGNLANVILSQSGGNYAAVGTANIAYSVANAAQPNITSVGTLTNVVVSGNATVNGNITSNGTAYLGNISTTGDASITTLSVGATANLGAVANVRITGGTNGYVLSTNGSGNLSWVAQSGGGGNGVPGGTNTQVQFNDANSFAGNTGFTFNKTTGIFSSPFLAGNGNGLSNIQGANVSGFVANANIANTAFAVAGANVSGTVGNANLSQYLDVSDVNNNFSYHVVLSAGSGDRSLHIDADDNLQYNPADGTLTATRVDATYVLADLQFSNGYPAANVTGLGNIATINLTGSNANVLYGNGVFAAVASGANTGNVTFDDNIVIGTGDEFGGSGLYLAVGPNSIANSAVQYLRVRGGDAPTHIHLDTGNNQFYDQYFGDDAKYVKLELGDAGNVVVGTDDANGNLYSWSFTSDGNLILAGGNSVIQSIANSSLDILNPNVSTMVLTPDPGYGSQALVLDPTTTGHIHLRAPGANIDEPSANIFLGGEASSFEVGEFNGAVPNLFIHSNNNTWMFDIDGNITFPRDGSNISTDPYLKILGGPSPQILSEDASLAGPANLAIVTDYLNLSGSNGNRIAIYADNGEIGTEANMALYTNLADPGNIVSWILDTTGNLTLPGNLVIAGNSNVFGTNASLLQTTDNRPLLALSSGANGAVSSLWVEDIGNVGTSNIAAVYANPTSGSKIVRIAVGQNGNAGPNLWDFGATGNLTLPTGGHIIVSGGIVGSGASPAPYVSGFDSIGALEFTNGTSNVTVTANTSSWTFGIDGILSVPRMAIGASAGANAQGLDAVAVGLFAGNDTQGTYAVAVGTNAGKTNQGQQSVAIGHDTGYSNQGSYATALGHNAATYAQGNFSVAVGHNAGYQDQGANSVAIGYYAGAVSQGNNSIILNATGAQLNQTVANTFTVAPVRNDVSNIAEVMFYNTTSKEVTYGNTISVAGNVTAGNISAAGNITGNTNGFAIGYLNIPQVAAANATLALTDAGKHYYSTTAGNFTLTVPTNANVAFATGTAVSIVVQAAGNILVNAASGVTLYMAGNSTAANRVVGGYGMATLMKVASDTWFINGTGVA